MLQRDFPRFTTYYWRGRAFAWQFNIPRRRIVFLSRRVAELENLENGGVENQQLTEAAPYEFEAGRLNGGGMDSYKYKTRFGGIS